MLLDTETIRSQAADADDSSSPTGGLLVVLLDPTVAWSALAAAAELAPAGPAPITVLTQVRRPLAAAGWPCGTILPEIPDSELAASTGDWIRHQIAGFAPLRSSHLEFTFGLVRRDAQSLLRARDYARVVIGARTGTWQRFTSARLRSALVSYCDVHVIHARRRG